jgi:hypothetical protein
MALERRPAVTEITIKLPDRPGLPNGPCEVLAETYTIRRRPIYDGDPWPDRPIEVRPHLVIAGEPTATNVRRRVAKTVREARTIIPRSASLVVSGWMTEDPEVIECWM